MSLTGLPLELQYQIYSDIPAGDILKLCRTNKYFAALCNDPGFWTYRAYREFGVDVNRFNDTNLVPRERYLQLLSTIGDKCVPGSEKYAVSLATCVSRSARDYDMDSWKYFLGLHKHRKRALISSMFGAVQGNNLPFLETLMDEYYPLYQEIPILDSIIMAKNSIKNNNMAIFKHLVHTFSNMNPDDYNEILNKSLQEAAKFSRLDIIEYIKPLLNRDYDPNYLLLGAVFGDNLNLIDRAIAEGATNYNEALIAAIRTGNISLVKRFLESGADNFNQAVETSAIQNNLPILKEIVKYFTRRGSRLDQDSLDTAIMHAISKNNLDLVDYLFSLNPTHINRAFMRAAESNDLTSLQYLYNKGRTIIDDLTLSMALAIALDNGLDDNVDYLLSLGASLNPYLDEIIRIPRYHIDFKDIVEKAYDRNLLLRLDLYRLLTIARNEGLDWVIPALESI